MHAKDTAKLDQAMATIADTLPPMLWRFYENSIEEGFDKTQALELTKSWLVGLRQSCQ